MTDIYGCDQFRADPNKNAGVVNLNVASEEERGALVKVYTPLSSILVNIQFFYYNDCRPVA